MQVKTLQYQHKYNKKFCTPDRLIDIVFLKPGIQVFFLFLLLMILWIKIKYKKLERRRQKMQHNKNYCLGWIKSYTTFQVNALSAEKDEW